MFRHPSHIVASCSDFQHAFPTGVRTLARRHTDPVVEHIAVDDRFPDGEVCVDLPSDAEGRHVLVLQSLGHNATGPDAPLLALLATVRAYQEHGAESITVFVPHLVYSRHDRRIPGERRPVTAQLVGQLLTTAGADHVIAIAAGAGERLRALYSPTSLTLLSSDDFLLSCIEHADRDALLVAPDAGAADQVARLASATGRRWLVADKQRLGPESVVVGFAAGATDLRGATALVIDDLICSAGTVEAAVEQLCDGLGIASSSVAVPHARLTATGVRRLTALHERGLLDHVHTTDSVAAARLPFATRHSTIDRFGSAIDGTWRVLLPRRTDA